MKVLIIGCGAVGTAAATLLAKEQDIDKVVIGDINLQNACQSVEAIKGLGANAEIEAVQVDASNETSVAKAAQGAAFVYNAASSACNLPILKACINIGANYMDTAAELPLPGVAENANITNLMALDSDAKAAGITAITCMGIGPGYTNIAVHYIINQMDTAERVRIKYTMYNTTVLSEAIKRSPLSSVVGFCTAQCGVTVALMVLRNKISQKGVITPDQLESPEDILKTMDPKAFRIEEKIEHQF